MSTEDSPVCGTWTRNRVLGVGGFGIVTLWLNTETDKYLALKKCRWDNASLIGAEMISKKQKERWTKEVEIMKRLSHRNVVRSVPLPTEFQDMKSELPILSMEFCSLGDLRQWIHLLQSLHHELKIKTQEDVIPAAKFTTLKMVDSPK